MTFRRDLVSNPTSNSCNFAQTHIQVFDLFTFNALGSRVERNFNHVTYNVWVWIAKNVSKISGYFDNKTETGVVWVCFRMF